ncbi:MAG: IS3 family transposase, partial [Tannerellaceae bacterium]|nr:IS3 family transposase [Tannerellaceae bacterium]
MSVVQALRRYYKLSDLLSVSSLSRSTFYYHLSKREKEDKYATHKDLIRKIYATHRGCYGYRRIRVELSKQGYALNHKTVLDLMRCLGIVSHTRRRKYKSYRGERAQVAPNVLGRNFQSQSPNQKWATDITEFSIKGSKLYLSPIIDLYNRKIISYTLSERPTFKSVLEMLEKALEKLPATDRSLILHSDQGWHYQMNDYRVRLQEKGILQSMSRKGDPLDNAVIENFFGILKSGLFHLKQFDSVKQLKEEIEKYIHYYNTKRIKLSLMGISPVQY